MGRHDGELAVAIEGPLAGHQFIERDAHRIDVGTRIGRGDALDLLRRHVVQGADGGAGLGELMVRGRTGDAEIHQLDHARGRQHHVGGLDVAMDHAAGVRVFQGGQHLHDVVDRLGRRQRPILEALIEGDALDELHHHEELILHAHRGAQGGDVRVLQAGLYFDFAQKAVGEIGLIDEIGKQHLHGFHAIRDDVADLVDLAHAAGAKDADNLIVADGGTNLEIHDWPTCWRRRRRLWPERRR